MAEVVVARIIEVLIDELDERRESQYWLQLRLLERELRLMFAVLLNRFGLYFNSIIYGLMFAVLLNKL